MQFKTFVFLCAIVIGNTLIAEEPKPIEMVIRPRAVETPALKYRLFPTEAELKTGNAAPILLRLPWNVATWMEKVFPKLHEWNDRPLTAPEWKNWNDELPERFYQEMKRAAFRSQANWEYPLDETTDLYSILLPDVQGLRTFLGAGLSGKIRYHLTRGELDAAREGILVGFANSRHIARTPFIITQFVALSIHQIMLSRVEELISQPQSPNLYWALTTLPDSLVDLPHAASFEAGIFTKILPAVHDLDRPRDVKEWQKMALQLIHLLEVSQEIPTLQPLKEGASVYDQLLRRLDPAGRNRLIAFVTVGRSELPQLLKISAEKVAAMSDEEAGIRWYVYNRLSRDQSLAAALVLPPREAFPRLKELQAEVQSMREKTGIRVLYFSDPISIYLSAWSLKRKIQSLRVIEAVRHYLATHEGKLPEKLGEIRDLPIPLDPLTDLPFEWKVEGKTATLKTPPLPAGVLEPDSARSRSHLLEYRLQVEP